MGNESGEWIMHGMKWDNRVNYYALMAICDVARKKYGTPVWSEQNEKY